MTRRLHRLCAAALISLAPSLTPSLAFAAQPAPAKPAQAPAPPSEAKPPPYEAELLRLAEIIGALAYLRDLCGAGDGDSFRAKMTGLLDAEARSPERKETLAGAYNRGFRDYEMFYRACTPAAREIIARFLDEAGKISREMATRYGG